MKNTLFALLFFIPVVSFSQVTVQEDDTQSLWKGITGYELVSQRSNDKVAYTFYYRNSEKGAKLEELFITFSNLEDALTFFETGLKTLETSKEFSLIIDGKAYRMYKSVGTLVFSGRSSSGILNKTQILRLLEILNQQEK
jgi:hypothetical protein